MPKGFLKYASAGVEFGQPQEDGFIHFEGTASSGQLDRHQDVIAPEFWSEKTISNYMANPVLLFGHSHKDIAGVITEARWDSTAQKMRVKGKVSKSWSGAWQVEQGLVRMLSVSLAIEEADMNPKGGLVIKSGEWMETSLVAVGANRDAVFSISKSFDKNVSRETIIKQFNHMTFFEKIAQGLKEKLGIEVQPTEEDIIAALEGFDLEKAVGDAVAKTIGERQLITKSDLAEEIAGAEVVDLTPLQEAVEGIKGKMDELENLQGEVNGLKDQLADLGLKLKSQPGGNGATGGFKTIENIQTGLKSFKIGSQKDFNK